MPGFNLGIDTGGTYTDAALVDMRSREIVASAKRLTTYGNLATGVRRAMEDVLADAAMVATNDINLVSISTTLATNALAEGKRARVGVFLIGFNEAMVERTNIAQAMPEAVVTCIQGGHIYTGEEQAPLDEGAIKSTLESLEDQVEAFAVAAHYAVRNPSHERRAETLIRDLTRKPVTVSRDLSDALDGPRRALTAALNASIVTRIVNLISAVSAALESHNISAPLMVVKGDGSIASAQTIVSRPIETILSGPAASVIGARFLTRENDFVVADIGGTTTDVAVAKNGWPNLSEQGSRVGGYRTLVKAIDMRTVALGGDSQVQVDFQGRVSLGTNRVVPVSLLATEFPHIIHQMQLASGNSKGARKACQFVFRIPGTTQVVVSEQDQPLLETITAEPRPYAEVIRRASDESRIARLVRSGAAQIAGVTPSDAAHVLGLQSQWSADAANLACDLLGRGSGFITSTDDHKGRRRFARTVLDQVVKRSTHLLAEQLTGMTFHQDNALVEAVTSGKRNVGDLVVAMTPDFPLISVGGPAPIYYPRVGERLGTQCVLPDHGEVANAVGAAAGLVRSQAEIEITQSEDGRFLIHHEGDPLRCESGQQALDQATSQAELSARSRCEAMGANNVEVEVNVKRIDLPDMDREHSLVAATVRVEATGTPSLDS